MIRCCSSSFLWNSWNSYFKPEDNKHGNNKFHCAREFWASWSCWRMFGTPNKAIDNNECRNPVAYLEVSDEWSSDYKLGQIPNNHDYWQNPKQIEWCGTSYNKSELPQDTHSLREVDIRCIVPLCSLRMCHECQTSVALPPQPQRELQPIPPPEEPWYHCGIDLVCNMPRTTQGFLHIVVIVCYLTKFVIARPLMTKTSREILGCLQEIYLTFGVPKILQHDQGPEFSSKVKQWLILLLPCLLSSGLK